MPGWEPAASKTSGSGWHCRQRWKRGVENVRHPRWESAKGFAADHKVAEGNTGSERSINMDTDTGSIGR